MSTELTTAEQEEFEACERVIGEGMKQMAASNGFDFASVGIIVHPVASAFPLNTGKAKADFDADIAARGVDVPITFWNNLLIDGRNRVIAMAAAGIDWREHAEELDADQDPIAFVVGRNIHRRHLSESQRAMIAAAIRNTFDKQAAERRNATLKQGGQAPVSDTSHKRENGRSSDVVGAMLGVSGRSVDRATAVLESGDKSLIADVEAGKVTVTAAARQLKDDQAKSAALVGSITAGASDAKPVTVRSELRKLREKQDSKIDVDGNNSAAMLQQSAAEHATPKQAKLVELFEMIKQMAAPMADILDRKDEWLAEHWTAVTITTIRNKLSGIETDIKRLHKILQSGVGK